VAFFFVSVLVWLASQLLDREIRARARETVIGRTFWPGRRTEPVRETSLSVCPCEYLLRYGINA